VLVIVPLNTTLLLYSLRSIPIYYILLKSGIPENLNVKVDCVIVAVAHDEFKNNPFLKSFINKLLEKV